jgi:hypothetical protein
MDIGSILLGLAVLILAAFLISQPLLDRRQQRQQTLSEADLLREQRDRLLSTLRDLDFDQASGKIQEEDYTPLRAKLVAEGAAVLKKLDELRPAAPARLESQLEQAIAARRKAHLPMAPTAADEIERAIAARRRGKAPTAPAMANVTTTDEVEQAIAARRKPRPAAKSGDKVYCPQCGQAALSGDKYCAKCGAKLPDAPSTKDSA